MKSPGRRLRGARTSVRLHPDDKLLLRERAASRQMAVATCISVLVRAHLRNLSPLPKDELMALKQSVAELSAIGRNLNQLMRLAHQGMVEPTRTDLLAILKACDSLLDDTKDLNEGSGVAHRPTRMWAESDAKVEFQVREQAATSIGSCSQGRQLRVELATFGPGAESGWMALIPVASGDARKSIAYVLPVYRKSRKLDPAQNASIIWLLKPSTIES